MHIEIVFQNPVNPITSSWAVPLWGPSRWPLGQELISFLGSQTASHVSRPNVGLFSTKEILTIWYFPYLGRGKLPQCSLLKTTGLVGSWQEKEGRNGEKKEKETVDQELEYLSSKLQICTYHESPYVTSLLCALTISSAIWKCRNDPEGLFKLILKNVQQVWKQPHHFFSFSCNWSLIYAF